MSDTASLLLQVASAGDDDLVARINSILARAGKSMPLIKISSDTQVGAKVLEVDVYVYTIEKNRALVTSIEDTVRQFGDDLEVGQGEIVLLVTDESGFTRITRPGEPK